VLKIPFHFVYNIFLNFCRLCFCCWRFEEDELGTFGHTAWGNNFIFTPEAPALDDYDDEDDDDELATTAGKSVPQFN